MKKEVTEKDLLQLKANITAAKTTVSELTGQKTALIKQMKEVWKCNSIDIAEKKLDEMDKEIEALSAKIKAGIEELQTKYNFE